MNITISTLCSPVCPHELIDITNVGLNTFILLLVWYTNLSYLWHHIRLPHWPCHCSRTSGSMFFTYMLGQLVNLGKNTETLATRGLVTNMYQHMLPLTFFRGKPPTAMATDIYHYIIFIQTALDEYLLNNDGFTQSLWIVTVDLFIIFAKFFSKINNYLSGLRDGLHILYFPLHHPMLLKLATRTKCYNVEHLTPAYSNETSKISVAALYL